MTDNRRAIIMFVTMFFYLPWSKYSAGLFLILKLSPTTAIFLITFPPLFPDHFVQDYL